MDMFGFKPLSPILVYLLVVAVGTSPIWLLDHFAVQDGSAHVYNGYLLGEWLKGNEAIRSWLDLNTLTVPNSSGHWIIAALIQVFPAFITQKIMLIGTYGGLVAAITFLRYTTAGKDRLETSIILGAALGFNWFWFGGFFNFMIGVIAAVVLIALAYRWRQGVTFGHIIVIALLLLGIYVSHIVSFVMAVGGILILALLEWSGDRKRNSLKVILALLPSIAAIAYYRATTSSPEPLRPVWRWLTDSDSLFTAVRNFFADPFIIISRRTLPYTDLNSNYLAVLSPGFWVAACVTLLLVHSLLHWKDHRSISGTRLSFALLFAIAVIGALAAPDDFGLSNGGILRERALLCGLCVFVPLISSFRSRWIDWLTKSILVYVLIFQTTALWNYGTTSVEIVDRFSVAQSVIDDDDRIASIVNVEDGFRFHSVIEPQLGLLTSVGKDTIVWDNYELGHYLFPLVTRSLDDRKFIRDVSISHAFVMNGTEIEYDQTLARLELVLNSGNQKFTKVIVWGRNSSVDEVLFRWFEAQPIFEAGNVRVLVRR